MCACFWHCSYRYWTSTRCEAKVSQLSVWQQFKIQSRLSVVRITASRMSVWPQFAMQILTQGPTLRLKLLLWDVGTVLSNRVETHGYPSFCHTVQQFLRVSVNVLFVTAHLQWIQYNTKEYNIFLKMSLSDLGVTSSTFKNRLKSDLHSRALV